MLSLLNDGICFAERQKREYPRGVSISFADETAFYQANIVGVGPPGVYSPGHLWSPLHNCHLQLLQIESLHRSSNYNTQVSLSKDGKLDVNSWITNLPSLGGKPYSASDSRLDNFLGCFQNRLWSSLGESSDRKGGGTFTRPKITSTYRYWNSKSLMKDQSQKVICLKIDNSTAVAYLNNRGGVRTPSSYAS